MFVLLLRLAEVTLVTARIAVFLLIILFILPFLTYWKKDLALNPYYAKAVAFEQTISEPYDTMIKAMFPNAASKTPFELAKIIILLMISGSLRRFSRNLHYYANYTRDRNELARWKSDRKMPIHSDVYSELQTKLDLLDITKDKHESQKLYEEITELKKKLQSMSRFFAFLSIDVVDSTGMKNSEDRSLIQMDSLRFKKMVQKIFDNNLAVKSAWTPDGAMVCFNTVDNAILAAQEVLAELSNFNLHVKKIQRDFLIRCGIHSGIIYYDEHLPLEEITDQVIDIAGHMQKHAQPNTIAISQPSIKPVTNVEGFHKVEQVVDGMQVFCWSTDKEATPSGEKIQTPH